MLHNRDLDMIDEELYRRFLDGDTNASEKLITLYGQGLILFIYGFVKDIYYAEELMIEAFARLMMSGGKFQGASSLKTYLFAIARNLALRHLKKHRYEKHISFKDITGEPDGEIDHSPEANYLREEKSRQLYKSMQTLKHDHREVLHLLFFENMSYAEAGKVLGKTPKQIDNLVYYAKFRIKIELEKEGVTGYEE